MKNIYLILLLILPYISFCQSKEKKKDVNYAFIPIVMYNSSFGTQVGAMGTAFFKMNNRDSISPASKVGFFGSYFSNTTFFGGLFSKMYFKEDNYRTKASIGYGDIKFQKFFNFPEEIPAQGEIPTDEEGQFVDYNTKMAFIYIEGTKQIYNNFYLGARFTYSQVSTTFSDESIPDEDNKLFGFGVATEYDDRNSVFYPQKGQNAKVNTFTFLEAFGSTSQYNQVKIEYNKYFSLNDNSVILARLYSAISFGDSIPTAGENKVGRDDLRGYTDGKYRGNQVYALQTELRWNFYKKWGLVAFGGAAISTNDWNGNNYSGILPAIGTGIRFKAIPSRNINIGIDVAKGKGDWGVYFRIGEAFTR